MDYNGHSPCKWFCKAGSFVLCHKLYHYVGKNLYGVIAIITCEIAGHHICKQLCSNENECPVNDEPECTCFNDDVKGPCPVHDTKPDKFVVPEYEYKPREPDPFEERRQQIEDRETQEFGD